MLEASCHCGAVACIWGERSIRTLHWLNSLRFLPRTWQTTRFIEVINEI